MEKKMSLNQAWIECLKMWKWIIGRKSGGLITELKTEYLCEKNIRSGLKNNCFFCEYAVQNGGYADIENKHRKAKYFVLCSQCPGYLVSKTFSCEGFKYTWYENPNKFYKKLLQLNQKRKKE